MSSPSDRKAKFPKQVQSGSGFRPMGQGPGGPQEEESLRNSIRVLRKRKYLIYAWAGGFLLLSLLVCAVMTNNYTATATLLVDEDNSSGVDLEGLSSIASAVGGEDELKVELNTHASNLGSDSTILGVVHQTGLDQYEPYKYKPHFYLWWINNAIKAESKLPLDNAPYTRDRLLKIVNDRLEVKPTDESRLITVAYRDEDPNRAALIANTFVNTYIHEYLESRFHATAEASDWLTGQLDALKAHVEDSQQKLSDYERKNGLGVLMLGMATDTGGSSGGGGGSMVSGTHIPALDKLEELNSEVTAAEADRISKEAIYRLTQSESPEVVLGLNSSSLASGVSSAVLTEGNGLTTLEALRGQETMLHAQYSDDLSKYGARNPHLAELQAQLTTLDQAMQDEMDRIRQRAKNDFELARSGEIEIQKSYDRQQGEVDKLNDSSVQLQLLAGDALSSRLLYEDLYSKLQEANIGAGVTATNLSNVDPARAPGSPSRPLWLVYPAIGLGAGLLLGIGAAFIKENLDDSILAPDQVEEIAWLPVLSHIPRIREKDRVPPNATEAASADPSVLVSNPRTPVAEAYRALRTAIQLSAPDRPQRKLLITSPMSGDGKTTLVYNVGIAFAQSGRRVLIIDSDMRKPGLHPMFGVPRSPGLSEVLTGSVRLEDAVRPHAAIEGLHFLPAGVLPPNPADLVGSKQMEALLEKGTELYDLVFVDSPPLLMVTDPVILSTKVDGAIVVIRSGKTTKMMLRRACEILEQGSCHTLGVVINAVDTRSAEYRYSYGYNYSEKYYEEES
jgi:polysaccharide biosynthesis transport protein